MGCCWTMEDLQDAWSKIDLNEEESIEIETVDLDIEEIRNCERRCLLRKVCANRRVGLEVLRSTMLKVWKVDKAVTFKFLGENLFAVMFVKTRDRDRALVGRPWLFDNAMFLLKLVDLNISPHAKELTTECFWVQLHRLPMGCINCKIGEQIGNLIGRVVMVDVPYDRIGWGQFL